jgi:hypothetical protein
VANNSAEGSKGVRVHMSADALRAMSIRGDALLARLQTFYRVDADVWSLILSRKHRVTEGLEVVMARQRA